MAIGQDLIEPYWNVKLLVYLDLRFLGLRFNRTILECKASYLGLAQMFTQDLIEPYWNVKIEYCYNSRDDGVGI